MAKIDLNIFNALNLINPALGKAYQQKGYNPFDDEFVLQNDYVKSLLIKAKDKKNIKTEDFLEKGNKDIAEIFEVACKNTEDLENEIESMFLDKTQSLKSIIVFLKNRKELLSQAIKKLKNEKENSFLLYRDIVGIDTLYSEIVKETFFEKFDKNIIIENFLKLCKMEKEKSSHKEQEKLQTQNMLSAPLKVKEKTIEIQKENIVENNTIEPKTYNPKANQEIEK